MPERFQNFLMLKCALHLYLCLAWTKQTIKWHLSVHISTITKINKSLKFSVLHDFASLISSAQERILKERGLVSVFCETFETRPADVHSRCIAICSKAVKKVTEIVGSKAFIFIQLSRMILSPVLKTLTVSLIRNQWLIPRVV